MAKLLFVDDDNRQHSLTLQNTQTKQFAAGDVIIAYYEVGEASLGDSNMALEQLRALLKTVFPKDVQIIAIATRNGAKDVEIKALKHKGKITEEKNG